MKSWLKHTLSIAVTLVYTVFVTTSCVQSDLNTPMQVDKEVEVMFNAAIVDDIATRAWDGRNIDKLYVELYCENNQVGNRHVYDVTDGKIDSFSINLIHGQTYTAVFWAQNSSCYMYNIENFKAISIYNNTNTNFENIANSDVFYDSCIFTVNDNTLKNGVDVQLIRPFALVIAGTDIENFDRTLTISTSLTIKNIADTFNAVSGTTGVTAEEYNDKTFNFIPDGTTIPGKDNQIMLGIAYVLPKNVSTSIVISTTVGSQTKQTTVNLDKLEGNKRYNIIGNLLPMN